MQSSTILYIQKGEPMIIDNLASYLDYASHNADTMPEIVKHICAEVLKHGFESAFANPHYIPLMKKLLKNKAHIGTVISFPLGQETIHTKISSLEEVVHNGADIIDVCLNIAHIKDHQWKKVTEEMETLLARAQDINKNTIIQFIGETGYLTDDEIQKIAELMVKAGSPFFKTCSGYGPRGVVLKDIKLIRSAVGNDIRIKAAGGIETHEKAVKFIVAGADRIGTSHAVDIVTYRKR
jgi:deoxyribose-phosphate aldolase